MRRPVRALRRALLATVVAATALQAATGTATAADPPVHRVDSPAVGIAGTPDGRGYWLATAAGGVYTFGTAGFHGAAAGLPLNAPVVAIAPTPSGRGYWLAAADGGVFSFGDARYAGSMGGTRLNSPVAGIAATASGRGYWLTAADGGVFSFGDAEYRGSMGGTRLNATVSGIAAAPGRTGYWLSGADGGVFSFGRADFSGSMVGTRLNAPVVGVARGGSEGKGYWLAASDGGVFAFGAARHLGSLADRPLNAPVVGIARTGSGQGFWLVGRDGGVFAFGDAHYAGRIDYREPVPAGGSPGQRRLPRDLTLSQAGADLLTAFEGFEAVPRPDPVGHCTVGFGMKLRDGACTAADYRAYPRPLTREEARRLMREMVERNYAPSVRQGLPATPLYQHEFDALVAFTYNLGGGLMTNPYGSNVKQALVAMPPRYGDVPAKLRAHDGVKQGGRKVVYCGLYRRRATEASLFATGSYVKHDPPCPAGSR